MLFPLWYDQGTIFVKRKGEKRMKKIISVLLVMAISMSLLVACGGSDDGGNDSAVNPGAGTNQDANENQDVDSEAENTDNSQPDAPSINPAYESVELKSGNVAAKIFYDPEQVSVKEYGSWMTLQGVEKRTILLNLNIQECESADAYAKKLVDGYEDWALAKTSELKEVKFGDVTTKHFTLTYNEKSYKSDVKLETLTEEEIAQLEYTLNETTRDYYVIEVSEDTIIYATYTTESKMELLEYVVIEKE